MPNELGNGHYHLAVSDAGGGRSSCGEVALNRWSGDAVQDDQGFFIYLRDLGSGELWSATLQPCGSQPEGYKVAAAAGSVQFERLDHGILTRTRISVQAGADLEVRSVTLRNLGSARRRIELTSFVELALAPPQADLAHPAFSKLFVQTALLRRSGALLAWRRPRSAEEHWPTVFHALAGAPVTSWETNRLLLIGRGGDARHPRLELQGSFGNVLDPVFALRTVIELRPGAERRVDFILGCTPFRARVSRLLKPLKTSPFPARRARPRAEPASGLECGYAASGDEYFIEMPWNGKALDLPPAPWINVLANERFGCIVSERGAGCTWSRNSQLNRLTPWYNDAMADPHEEAHYLRDDDSGEFWSPLPGPAPAAAPYQVRHGFGYTSFQCRWSGLTQSAVLFVARNDPVKCLSLTIRNESGRPRRLSLFSHHRLALGTAPPPPGSLSVGRRGRALCASRNDAHEFSDGVVFSTVAGPPPRLEQLCRDRAVFLGRNGSLRAPLALRAAELVDSGPDAEPCFARRLQFALDAGEEVTYTIVLGEACGEDELRRLLDLYSDHREIERQKQQAIAFWREGLSAVRVHTPCAELDRLVNGWLPYQALSCRLWARTALYQSSGAYGFRDQLQDAGNLALLWPGLARQQILLHAAHQFEEGDVMHWWHGAPTEAGLRTRITDDLLWLPFVVAGYVRQTGDAAILDEPVPFLAARPLDKGEDDRYLRAEPASTASLFEHCCRALDRCLAHGEHGLPLMGGGDWNDGMNRVGRQGRGESVWLGFFLLCVLDLFMPLARQRAEPVRREAYAGRHRELLASLEVHGWDGRWYRRAYYDDGTALGSAAAAECRIDGLVQAWAVLSGTAAPARARAAMHAVRQLLVDEQAGVIKLLAPPFVNCIEDPGYIKGYVAGIRENGGQYTHAACWMVAAAAALGWRDVAMEWFRMLTPGWHTRDERAVQRYRLEPYVIAADIYGAAPHAGRGGWSWYTGSAGWAYRVALESLLGLRLEAGTTLLIRPCIPDHWPEYSIEYRAPAGAGRYSIRILNPGACAESVIGATLDGKALPVRDGAAVIDMRGGAGTYEVVVTLGAAAPAA